MLKRIAVNTQPLPLSINFAGIRTYGIIAVFVVLSVGVPWVFHQFNLAGATFLPMHIFVLVAALTCGWQAGVIVGLLTPFASYAISGMPVMTVLPQVAVEITVYGLIAGLLRQKYNLRIVWSLLGAMAGGRIALMLSVLIVMAITGNVYSPLGPAATPYAAVWHTVAQSWPGMLAQIAIIPVAFWLVSRYTRRNQTD